MESTPASLLERLRRPGASDAAWSRFVRLYTPLLFYWAKRMGLQQQDAADLVQDVFALLLRKLPEFSYDQQHSFRGWLRTVTLNKWREKCRRAALPVEADGNSLGEVCAADQLAASWEREYQQHLARHALELMRSEFEESTWKACWEIVANDRSPLDVAAELGISLGAAYAAKSRVLRRLRRELDGLLD